MLDGPWSFTRRVCSLATRHTISGCSFSGGSGTRLALREAGRLAIVPSADSPPPAALGLRSTDSGLSSREGLDGTDESLPLPALGLRNDDSA